MEFRFINKLEEFKKVVKMQNKEVSGDVRIEGKKEATFVMD